MKTMTLILDELDHRAVQRAIARRQTFRDEHGDCIAPLSDSNTAGAMLAEICRGWLEMLDLNRAKE